ncbi:hypothetical protein DFH06DRAFT_96288 [Mycena polygramma]|nr:hypothetical protein DFH06DRAFT_96288 [Mycena polygramma]
MLEDVKAADEDHILALEEEFRELTMQEADLHEQLVQVRTAKQGIRRLVAEKKNRYAPIFALPDELLVAIVEAAQQSTSAPIEVIASQISQRFRWAVLGASYLWSSIELRWGGRSDAERLAAYLERSRTCTVSVRLKYDSYHGEEECDYEEVPNELDTVAQHISRIRRLVVHCGGTGLHLLDVVSHLGGLHAPLLEYVDIFSRASDLDNWDEPALFFNGGAPRLTTLKLTNVDIDPGNPWISSITSLDLRGMQFPDISILYHCPQLTDVTLDDSTFFINAENTISTPFLRSLRGLCLNSRWPHSLTGGVLGSLHAPALEILEFSGVHGGSQISSFFNSPRPNFPP